MTSITATEAPTTSPTSYGKLRYVPAGHTVIPGSEPFGLPESSEFGDERIVPIHDIRPVPTVDQLQETKGSFARLTTHGFTAVKHSSKLHSAPYTPQSWHDPELVQQVYGPELEELVKRVTGAKKVIPESFLLRAVSFENTPNGTLLSNGRGQNGSSQQASAEAAEKVEDENSLPKQATGPPNISFPVMVGFSAPRGALAPFPKVHIDYVPAGARLHIRNFHPILTDAFAPVIAAEDRLQAADLPLETYYSTAPDAPRWAVYSVWRPIKPVQRDPLAVGDMRSFSEEDIIEIDVEHLNMTREGQVKGMHTSKACVGTGSDDHRWCYVSEQQPDEALIVGLWDSAQEGKSVGAGGAMHSSVELEGREGEAPRESLESRCWAIW